MPSDKCIDYVEFPAKDLVAVKRFYSACFGWTFTDYGPDYCSFSDGHLDGGFYRADCRAGRDQGGALVVLYAKDLEAVRQTVLEHGAELIADVFDFPGGRRFHFSDPNGNELAVWSDA
jgi:predicted enzyme related to lactoylglutathione lyase